MKTAERPGFRVATWIRPHDVARFRASLASAPELEFADAQVAAVNLETCDALLLTGGEDISAEFLRQPIADPTLIEEPAAARDAWEFPAVAHALARGWPILAVCRGVQVLNVALGGTLHLHVEGHRDPRQKENEVQSLRLARALPVSFPAVNSSHHQALDRLGDGLDVEAWCAADSVVEQVRHRSRPWCVGVQYHPERAASYRPLFEAFAAAVRATARR